MDPSRHNIPPENQDQDQTNNTNNPQTFHQRLSDLVHRGLAHFQHTENATASSSSAPAAVSPQLTDSVRRLTIENNQDSDDDVVMSSIDSTSSESISDPRMYSNTYPIADNSSPSNPPGSAFSTEPPSRNSTRRARVEDELDDQDERETNRQRMHSPSTPNDDPPHHFHPNLPHDEHEHPDVDPEHHPEHEGHHDHDHEHEPQNHGHGRWVMDQPGGHRVIFDIFVGPPQSGPPPGQLPNLQNLPEGAFVFNLPLGGGGAQGGAAAEGNPPNIPNNLLDHIRQQLENPPPELMQMLTGGFGFGEEPEDPERAKRLVGGLEEVSVGLIKRLKRVGGEGDEGSTNCAVCWEDLLDGDGGFEVKQAEGKKADVDEDTIMASGSGPSTSSDPSERPEHPKIVSLPCSHVFHANCLLPWFTRPHRTTCPSCRFDIDPDSLTYVHRPRQRRHRTRRQQPPAQQAPTNEQQTQTQPTEPSNTAPQQPGQRAPRHPRGFGIPPAFAALFGQGLNNVVPEPGPQPTPVAIPVTLNPDGPPSVLISGTPQNTQGPNAPTDSSLPRSSSEGPRPPPSSNDPPPPPPPGSSSQNTTMPPPNPFANPQPDTQQNQNQGPPQGDNPNDYLTLDISFVVPIPIPISQLGGIQPGVPRAPPQGQQQQQQQQPTAQPAAPSSRAPENPPPPAAPRPIPHPQAIPGIPGFFGGAFTLPPVGVGHAFNIGLGGHGFGAGAGPRPPPRPQSAPATGGSRPRSQSPPRPMPGFGIPFQSQQTQTAPQDGQPQQPQVPPGLADGFAAAFRHALMNAMNTWNPEAHGQQQQPQPNAQPPQAEGASEAPQQANAPRDDNDEDRATQRMYQDLFPGTPVPTLEEIREIRDHLPRMVDTMPNFAFGPGPGGRDMHEMVPAHLFSPTRPDHRRGRGSRTGEGVPPKPEWTLPPPPGLTLRQRVEKREFEMGLRCSDISCGVGPTDEDPSPIIDPTSIRQFAIRKPGDGSKAQVEHVCEHKFHAACLVSAERVAGYGREDKKEELERRDSGGEYDPDEDVEVSCPRCRTVGCISRADWAEGAASLL